MIHLDTNYLIGLAVRGSSPAQKVDQWLAAGARAFYAWDLTVVIWAINDIAKKL